jgi:hypothetical protein
MIIITSIYVANNWVLGSGNKESNDIKYAHLLSYSDIFMDRPALLLTGEGLGSEFKSKAAQYYVTGSRQYESELAYMELVRELGLPMAMVVVGAFVLPLYIIKRRGLLPARRNLVVAYLAYLVIASTNPLLTSSTGMIVVICMYSAALVPPGPAWHRQAMDVCGVSR